MDVIIGLAAAAAAIGTVWWLGTRRGAHNGSHPDGYGSYVLADSDGGSCDTGGDCGGGGD